MYYDEMLETANDIDFSLNNLQKSATAELRKMDPNYEKFSIPFNKTWKDGKYYKKIAIENFGSGQTSSRIRNAVTGQRYPYLVGSRDEDLFFKVTDSTGRNGRKYPLTLFYDSPEQYENQNFVILSSNIKEKWNEKNMIAMQKRVM